MSFSRLARRTLIAAVLCFPAPALAGKADASSMVSSRSTTPASTPVWRDTVSGRSDGTGAARFPLRPSNNAMVAVFFGKKSGGMTGSATNAAGRPLALSTFYTGNAVMIRPKLDPKTGLPTAKWGLGRIRWSKRATTGWIPGALVNAQSHETGVTVLKGRRSTTRVTSNETKVENPLTPAAIARLAGVSGGGGE